NGLLVRDGSEKPLAEPLLLVPGLAFFSDGVTRFDDGGAFSWVTMLQSAGNLRVPIEQRSDFMAEITRFSVLPPIEMPQELRIVTRALENPPQLKVRPSQESSWMTQRKLCATVTFEYAGVQVSETHEPAVVHDPRRNEFFRRDRAAEVARLNRLPELGFRPTGSWQKHRWELPPSRLPAVVRALVSEGWRVDAEGKLYRRAGSFQMNVASGVDWFELHGSADFEGQCVEMPQLLKAIARGEHSVRLGDGTYGLLPEAWLKRYRLVAALGKANDGQLRFERHQAGLLDALLAEQPEVTFDDGFARVRQEMATFAGIRAAEAAVTFHGQLRDYQREGLGWLQFLRRFGFGGCLADDMGLGKTVQVLALLDCVERSRPSLIVAPRSLIFNWKQEAARFTPRLRLLDQTGMERMNRWPDIHNHDVILTTYGTLRRDAPLLKDIHFDTIVLDEAQTIKNATTENAKAARLLKADHRLALTGTPVENRLGDLWSLFEFLNPGLLGTATVFRTQIAGKNGSAGGSTDRQADDSIRFLSKALRPFLLRRTKEQVARELPPKTEQTIYCELKPEQRRLYNELRAHYRDALLGRIEQIGIENSRMQILEALLRLRQAACHPGLIDKERLGQSSAKMDSLIPQIAELIEGGHKALIFSQFTSFLDIVRKRLDQEELVYEYLDGRTRDRQACVQRFQEDDRCRLFLISLRAGGLGLNLTAAEYVFLLDPWWNPAIEAQAIDRSHRIGVSSLAIPSKKRFLSCKKRSANLPTPSLPPTMAYWLA
ncbi:MAG: helicase SNF2, partial [Acidobacteria bacterium]